MVCFDSAHNNYHRPDGAYQPFEALIRQDGFRTHNIEGHFDPNVLDPCKVLIITTPVQLSNIENWSFPHPSAFDTEEIQSVFEWTRAGGGLLLIMDHSPIPGAMADLAAVFGVAVFDGEARNSPARSLPDLFSREDNTLRDHAVTRGRNKAEAVQSVATWTGSAFHASREFSPVLVYGKASRMWTELSDTFPKMERSENPVFEIEGWLAAASRHVAEGRLFVLAETAMCTATLLGERKVGMNTEEGGENPQFCINTVRWLAGAIR